MLAEFTVNLLGWPFETGSGVTRLTLQWGSQILVWSKFGRAGLTESNIDLCRMSFDTWSHLVGSG